MTDRVDYYRLLQVRTDADTEIIEAAYKKLAMRYHPDVNKDPSAVVKMKQLNEARDTLTNPARRADYDREMKAHSGAPGAGTTGGSTRGTSSGPRTPPPRPIVIPNKLRVEGAVAGRVYRASFLLRNEGGPCRSIKLGVAFADEAWLSVTGAVSVQDDAELPMRVTVEAVLDGSRSVYNGTVYAELDGIEAPVAVHVLAHAPAASTSARSSPAGAASSTVPTADWLGQLLSLCRLALGMMLLVPGVLLDLFMLLGSLVYWGQATPDKGTQFGIIFTGVALSLILVAPGMGLLRGGLVQNAAEDKWWRLSFDEIKGDDRWWLPLGLGAVGGIVAWNKVKSQDRRRALKMLTWGIVVGLIQPLLIMILSMVKGGLK